MIACNPPDSSPPETAGLMIDDNDRAADTNILLFEVEIILGILVVVDIHKLCNLLPLYELSNDIVSISL